MGSEQRAVCLENDALVEFMRKWWKEMEEKRPKYYTENTERNIQRAFSNVCHCKTPIKTLKDFQNIKGVGKWFVKHMRDFFITDSGDSGGDNFPKEGKKAKRTRNYLPQKNSAAYALLITLYREIEKGKEYMHKQELIDAADASGLARVPIALEKGRGKLGSSGSSKREWYSGWNAMAKLVDKGLVVKTSCPAKYKLSDAGRQAACECLLRSNMLDSSSHSINRKELSDSEKQDVDNLEFVSLESAEEVESRSVNLIRKDMRDNHPMECLERLQATMRSDSADASICDSLEEDQPNVESRIRMHSVNFRSSTSVDTCAASLTPCTSYVRRLPVGDGIWVARHRHKCVEYVLDFIVERKNVDDLRCSIRDNRYKDQKLRLLRTGLQKIIYMVEGDPNVCEATESIKTACFTTEILEGFDVQRTSSLADTLKRYGYLTLAINDYYKSSCEGGCRSTNACPEYRNFIRKCEDLDKMTVSDVFASQLMQVPQVTEEVAMAVLDCYPTLYSLACAYSLLDGDTHAQEELLIKRSKNVINAAASRNIFRLVWQS